METCEELAGRFQWDQKSPEKKDLPDIKFRIQMNLGSKHLQPFTVCLRLAGNLIMLFKHIIMLDKQMDRDDKRSNKDAPVKPDPETLHKTDPQENMEGPVSSLMHKSGKGFDTKETREEAENKRDKNL